MAIQAPLTQCQLWPAPGAAPTGGRTPSERSAGLRRRQRSALLRLRAGVAVQVPPYIALAPCYDAALGVRFFRGARAAFEEMVRRHAIRFKTAADIGCGTGLFACYLSRRWDVPTYGVDISPAMLAIAQRRCASCRVGFLRQDIRCLRLPEKVDLITANFDVVNHLLRPDDVRRVFARVHDNLRPCGHFIFDFLRDGTQSPGRKVTRGITGRGWSLCQSVRWGGPEGLIYTRVVVHGSVPTSPAVETHVERRYDPREVGAWLLDTGFTLRAVLDATTLRPPGPDAVRLVIVAQRGP